MKQAQRKSFDWYKMQQRFSIRKYHFGAASVLLGTALILGIATNVHSVQAEEKNSAVVSKVFIDKVDEATKSAEVSTPKKETTYAAPTVANPVEVTPTKFDDAKAPAEKVEEVKEDATMADRSALDSSILATNVPAKVEATSATETTNEIFKPEHSLSDDRKNSAIRKEDLETGYSGFRSARRRREAGSNPDETPTQPAPTQPASTQPASGEYAGTEIKAYYDNNHNGVFDEGDELISSTVIPPAPKGENGNDGKDAARGAELLSGIIAPTPEDGKDGDTYIDATTGDVYKKRDGAWGKIGNLRGPQGEQGQKGENGKDGRAPKIKVEDIAKYAGTTSVSSRSGIRITVYDDKNNNDEFDEGDTVLNTKEVYNGTDGRNGVDGQTPKVKAERDEAKKQTTLTFYIDKDGDGNYTEGTDTLVQTSIVKDGQDGATGQAGRDGKEVLNGKVDPQATDGKDGDSFVNTVTGDVFVKKNNAWEQAGNIKGPKGDKGENGKDGFTPEVTVTDNHDGSHTITITQPEGRPALTTVVKNGENGQTPKVKAVRDEAKKQTTLTFYIDKDGDGNYTEGTDTLVQTSIVKDGQDGAAGQAGRDGKEVLNGKVDPTPRDGKDGDSFVNTATGDVFVKKNNAWEPAGNIKGPKGDKGENGKDGFTPEVTVTDNHDGSHTITITQPEGHPALTTVVKNGENGQTPKVKAERDEAKKQTTLTFYIDKDGDGNYTEGTDTLVQTSIVKDGQDGAAGRDGQAGRDGKEVLNGKVDPQATDGKDGDSFVNTVTGDVFVKKNNAWEQAGNIKGPKGDKGENGKDGFTPEVTVTDNHDGSHTITITQPEGRPALTTVVKNGENGQTPKVKAERDEAKKQTTLTFYIDKDGDGNYTEGTDTLVQTSIVKDGQDGAVGQAGRDGKEVLNGKVDPQATDGKDGDSFVNTATGDVFVKKNNAWEPAG
ncbi:YSIRK-type signal peptide-containing protein, partial [Streptococcus mitis]|uniref:collagen-flanked surface repeat-containing protein n=1 Tax=Streptococcus mitis TaxID=28037 RepID=UPI0039C1A17A